MFEKLPYTNFHDLNLDWIIKTLKNIENSLDNFEETSQSAIASINSAVSSGTQTIQALTASGTQTIQAQTASGVAHINSIIANFSVHHRMVLLADSYGGRVNANGKTIANLVQGTMNIPDEDFYSSYVPGAAFAHQTTTHKFITQLENCTISDKDSVTEIVIVCGANDANYYSADTMAAVLEFYNYAKANYRIAKVIIVGLGLTFTPLGISIKERARNAFRASTQYGVIYAQGSEYVLMNDYLLESDRVHPNLYGVPICAQAVCNAITSYYCNTIYYKSFTDTSEDMQVAPVFSLTNPSSASLLLMTPQMYNARMQLINGQFDLVSANKGPIFTSRFNLNGQVFSSSQNVITVELTHTLFVGKILVSGAVTSPVGSGVMVDTDDKTNRVPCKIYFKFDETNSKPYLIFEPVGSLTLTAHEIEIYGDLHLHL